MNNLRRANFVCLISLLFFLSFEPVAYPKDTSAIMSGKAKLTGRIVCPAGSAPGNIVIEMTLPYPISGDYGRYKAITDQSGKFAIEVDVETKVSLAALTTGLDPEKYLMVKLTNGGVTNIEIVYGSEDKISNIRISPEMNYNDVLRGFEVRDRMIGYRSGRQPQPLYNRSTDYFLDYARGILSERLAVVKNDTLLSVELKNILAKDYRLILYNTHVLDYEEEMMLNYSNTGGDKNQKPVIQKIGRSYFRFLKDFGLNDPQYLHCFEFLEFQKRILQNEILNLPEIGESDIPSWLAKVKSIMSPLVGFSAGPYYDILAANAYARQLNEQLKPLTGKQQKNITAYWKNGEIAKILFRKNQGVRELDQLKSPLVVSDVSAVPADKVVETILAKHKEKIVFIDLWATWCAPCLEAMQEFRSTKNELKDKGVAFIYLTNGSSPRKLWEEKIQGIGSEHYYLTDTQWEYVMDRFGFDAIPSYLLYNKKGELVNKFTAFPGNNEVKQMINDLL